MIFGEQLAQSQGGGGAGVGLAFAGQLDGAAGDHVQLDVGTAFAVRTFADQAHQVLAEHQQGFEIDLGGVVEAAQIEDPQWSGVIAHRVPEGSEVVRVVVAQGVGLAADPGESRRPRGGDHPGSPVAQLEDQPGAELGLTEKGQPAAWPRIGGPVVGLGQGLFPDRHPQWAFTPPAATGRRDLGLVGGVRVPLDPKTSSLEGWPGRARRRRFCSA